MSKLFRFVVLTLSPLLRYLDIIAISDYYESDIIHRETCLPPLLFYASCEGRN